MSEALSGGVSGGLQGVGSGAVAGASIGFVVGGPAGAATGLLIGAAAGATVGTISGALGGSKKAKSKKYTRMAQAVQLQREQNATQNEYLQQIRQARIARADSMQSAVGAEISTSSLSTSALSSIGSQLGYKLDYLAEDRRLYDLYASYMRSAGKYADQYQTISAITTTGFNALETGAKVYKSYKTKQQAPQFSTDP